MALDTQSICHGDVLIGLPCMICWDSDCMSNQLGPLRFCERAGSQTTPYS